MYVSKLCLKFFVSFSHSTQSSNKLSDGCARLCIKSVDKKKSQTMKFLLGLLVASLAVGAVLCVPGK